jgi:redox-sensing transcriptional repressor
MARRDYEIPEGTIQRLPVYLYRLQALQAEGVQQVSSRELARQLRISPSRLRHDFHHFGGFSRPGHPYEVDHLVRRIGEILAPDGPVDFVIAGMGQLGQAIANYSQFERDGFRLAGLFDVNPRLLGLQFRGVPVQDLEALAAVVAEKGVRMGIITASPESAQEVAERMATAGIRGIWNFAPVNLEVPDDVVLHDEFFSVSIMSLRYKMCAMLARDRKAG